MRKMMVWKLKRMRKQRKLYNCKLCGKIEKPSQNSTVIMSVMEIQSVDNVYSNCGPQMEENVEVSKMKNEDNLKLLKIMREAFEDGGDVKLEDKNLHGRRGGVQYIMVQSSTLQYSIVQDRATQYRESFEDRGDVKREMKIYKSVEGMYNTSRYSTIQYSTLQYRLAQYSTVQYSTGRNLKKQAM